MANTYDTYKDSGVAWIGEIPEGWGIFMLSTYFFEHKNKNAGNKENNLLSLSYGAIIDKDINTKEGLLPESFEGYNIIQKDDIVFRLTDLQNDKRSLRTAICKQRGIITSAYTTIRSRGKVFPVFYNYFFRACDECKVLYGIGSGVRQSMNFGDLAKLQVCVPPLLEQKSIASFLDKKCEEIDSLIALQDEIIGELQAYKQSVITEAVTKGLDPNAKMKDSGIEWIGKIPEKWNRCKIQYLANLQSGRNLTTEQISDDGLYPVFGGNGIRGFYHDFSHEGDFVLIGRQGALCGNINYAHDKFWPTEHAVVCYPKNTYNYIWFGETLRTMNLGQYSLASAQPGLSVERIKQLSLPVPPLEIQNQIAEFIIQKVEQIDSLISLKQQKIAELKDYKKSIIYEYVTGKKRI
ncbi:MAG: restriction endonuclease subunit S [Muribaculum sp.]|nr:restriction endonuclease subunit S [Muribaculum sp.]